MAEYETPIEHSCDVEEGMHWGSVNRERPESFCDSAWSRMEYFVRELACGGGNFYGGWMKNPLPAMISCSDGFRPVSFYIETTEEEAV